MAREQQQQQATVGGEGEPMRKRKSVRFGECPDPGSSGGVGGVVPNLVPHLPGLDPDALYVISGPFPQYDEGSGISNMVIMATPVPTGVTVVAVPSGPPPTQGYRSPHVTGPALNVCKAPPGPPPGLQHPGSTPPAPAHNGSIPPAPAHNGNLPPAPGGIPPAPGSIPPAPGQRQSLHLMHWDLAHPTGQPIPLRQPNPPVYYNVPAPPEQGSCQSGSQSPASLSCSDLSEDSGTTQDSVCYPGWERCCPQQQQQQQYPGPGQFQQQCCQQWQQTFQPCHYPPTHPAFPHNIGYPTNQNNFPIPQAQHY